MAVEIGSMYVSLTATVQPFATAMAVARKSSKTTKDVLLRDVADMEQAYGKLHRSANQPLRVGAVLAASKAFETAADRANLLRAAMLSTTAAVGGLTAALSTNILLRYADTAAKVGNQIRTVAESTADLTAQQRDLLQLANRNRSSLQSTATLYTRIRRAVPTKTVEDVYRVTGTIQKGLQLGGASAQEAASAMIQLSQALASNRLQGEEMRAILETPLGGYLAKGIGVSIGQFRELGTAGEITADVIIKALERIGPEIEQAFSRATMTVDQALQVADNNLTAFIGSLDRAYGVSQAMASGIITVSENLDTLASAANIAALALAGVFLQRRIATMGGASGIGGLGAALALQRREIEEQATALRDAKARLEQQIPEARQASTFISMRNDGRNPMTMADRSFAKERLRDEEALRRAEEARAKALANLAAVEQQRTSNAAKYRDISFRAIAATERLAQAEARALPIRREMNELQSEKKSLERQIAFQKPHPDPMVTRAVERVRRNRIDDINLRLDAMKAARREIEKEVAAARSGLDALEKQEGALPGAFSQNRADYDKAAKSLSQADAQVAAARSRAELSRLAQQWNGQRNMAEQSDGARRAIGLLGEQLQTTNGALAAAEKQLTRTAGAMRALEATGAAIANTMKAAGAGILSFFGGWTGVAVTGALVGLGLWLEHLRQAAVEQENFNQKLRDMGLLMDRTPEQGIDYWGNRAAAARQEARMADDQREIRREEIADAGYRAGVRAAFADDPAEKAALEGLLELSMGFDGTADSARSLLAELNKLSADDRGEAFDEIAADVRAAAMEFIGAGEAAKRFNAEAAQAASMAKGQVSFVSDTRGMSDAERLAAIADRNRQNFLDDYVERLTQVGREAEVAAEKEKLLKDAGEAGITITEAAAEAEARRILMLRERGAAAEAARQRELALAQALSDMVGEGNLGLIAAASQNPFALGAKNSTAYDTDRMMVVQLERAAALREELAAGAGATPFQAESMDAVLQAMRERAMLSERAVQIETRAAAIQQQVRDITGQILPIERARVEARQQIAIEDRTAATQIALQATEVDRLALAWANVVKAAEPYLNAAVRAQDRRLGQATSFMPGGSDEARVLESIFAGQRERVAMSAAQIQIENRAAEIQRDIETITGRILPIEQARLEAKRQIAIEDNTAYQELLRQEETLRRMQDLLSRMGDAAAPFVEKILSLREGPLVEASRFLPNGSDAARIGAPDLLNRPDFLGPAEAARRMREEILGLSEATQKAATWYRTFSDAVSRGIPSGEASKIADLAVEMERLAAAAERSNSALSRLSEIALPTVDPATQARQDAEAAFQEAMRNAQGAEDRAAARSAYDSALQRIREREMEREAPIPVPNERRLEGYVPEADPYQEMLKGIQEQRAALVQERAQIGLTGVALDQARIYQELLNEAKRRGIELSAGQQQQLSLEAQALATLKNDTEQLAQATQDWQQSAQQGAQNLATMFAEAAIGARDWKDVLKSAIPIIIDLISKWAAMRLAQAGENGSGGFGAIISALFGNSPRQGPAARTLAPASVLQSAAGAARVGGIGSDALMPLTNAMSAVAPGTAFGGIVPNANTLDLLNRTAQAYGISPRDFVTLARIESGFNPLARNGQHRGMFQFSDNTGAAYGIGSIADRYNPALSADAAARLWQDNSRALQPILGRPAMGWEAYVAHQQGIGGAGALFRNPNMRAVDALNTLPHYASRPGLASLAVTGNGGNVNMTSAQFLDVWKAKFESMGGSLEQMASASQEATSGLGNLAQSLTQGAGGGGNPLNALNQTTATAAAGAQAEQGIFGALGGMLDQLISGLGGMLENLFSGLSSMLSGIGGGGGGGLFGGLFNLIGGLFGGPTSIGGLYADGGRVSGRGSGRSDSILARISHGEFVMNADATDKHLPLLEALNDNAPLADRLVAFAKGGMVGRRRSATRSGAARRAAASVAERRAMEASGLIDGGAPLTRPGVPAVNVTTGLPRFDGSAGATVFGQQAAEAFAAGGVMAAGSPEPPVSNPAFQFAQPVSAFSQAVETLSAAEPSSAFEDRRRISLRTGDLIVQGSITEETLPKVRQMISDSEARMEDRLNRNDYAGVQARRRK